MTDKIRIGIGPIGWANDDLRGWGPERQGADIMREIKQAGYVGTEMSYTYPQAPADLRKALDAHGLVLASAYRWTNFAHSEQRAGEIEAACHHVDFCAQSGARHALLAEGSYSLHWDLNGARPTVQTFGRDDWQRVCSALNEIGRYAERRGLKLAVHPHAGTAIETADQIGQLLDGTDPAYVGYCLDTGHACYGGADPLQLLQRWSARVRYVHLKDVRADVLRAVRAEGKTFLQAIQSDVFGTPGEGGSIDFEAFLKALLASGYEGWLVVEADQSPAARPALEVATAARRRLAQWLGETAPVV